MQLIGAGGNSKGRQLETLIAEINSGDCFRKSSARADLCGPFRQSGFLINANVKQIVLTRS